MFFDIAGEYFQELGISNPWRRPGFLLTRELSEKAGAGGREIYRYQSAEAIWNRMMEAEKQCIDKKYFPVEETEGESDRSIFSDTPHSEDPVCN